jgi:hypothetical protein
MDSLDWIELPERIGGYCVLSKCMRRAGPVESDLQAFLLKKIGRRKKTDKDCVWRMGN